MCGDAASELCVSAICYCIQRTQAHCRMHIELDNGNGIYGSWKGFSVLYMIAQLASFSWALMNGAVQTSAGWGGDMGRLRGAGKKAQIGALSRHALGPSD